MSDDLSVDEALIRAWNLGLDSEGWTDSVMDEAERLLPVLIRAGYAATDDAGAKWWFTEGGVARASELEDTSS